jgi:hypothetical protein
MKPVLLSGKVEAMNHELRRRFVTVLVFTGCFVVVGYAVMMLIVVNLIGVHGTGPYADMPMPVLAVLCGTPALATAFWSARRTWRRRE